MVTVKSHTSRFAFLFTFVIFYFTFFEQLNLVIDRFFDDTAVAAVNPDKDGRVAKWIIYSNWLLENPETYLFGNQKHIPFKYAPHNYFIFITYHIGLIVLFIFIVMLIKLLKLMKVNVDRLTFKSVYYIIPFPLTLMTVNSFGSAIYLWIFLPLTVALVYVNNDNKLKSQGN